MLTIAKNSNDMDFLKYAYSLGFKDFRLNMDYESESYKALENIKALNKTDVTVYADFQGVKNRIQLPKGENDWKFNIGDFQDFYLTDTSYPYITNAEDYLGIIKEGQILSIADDKIEGKVISINHNKICLQFLKVEYVLRQNAGCCFKGEDIPPIKMTKKVCETISQNELIKNKLVNWVILSFVTSAIEIKDFVELMHKNGIHVMAKIETPEGVDCIEDVSLIVDGFMIGRGDLKNTAKGKFNYYYSQALEKLCNHKSVFDGVGTFFLSNFSNTNILSKKEKNDVLHIKNIGLDYVMLSKEIVNSNYPYETLNILSKLCKEEDSRKYIVIEGDNGTGKTTIAKMFENIGYRVISEDEDLLSYCIELKKLKPGSSERFNAFMKYNEMCCERSMKYDKSLVVRSWISTISAAYADEQLSLDESLLLAKKLYNEFPVPNLVFRLECNYSERLKRINKRIEETNDRTDDISKERDERYQVILSNIKKMFTTKWIDIDTSELNPNEVFEIIKGKLF